MYFVDLIESVARTRNVWRGFSQQDSCHQPLTTRVRNIKRARNTLIEMEFVKRVIDMMANRIKVLHHRALTAQDDLQRVVRRTNAKDIDQLRADLVTLRQGKNKRTVNRILKKYGTDDPIWLLNQEVSILNARRRINRVEMEAGCDVASDALQYSR